VVLAGTVAADPVERRMPSGDEVAVVRAAGVSVAACTPSAASVETRQSSPGSRDRTFAGRSSQQRQSDRTRPFLACATCLALIEANDREGLAARGLVRQERKGGLRPGVTEEMYIRRTRTVLDDIFWTARSR
jgi:hypothetical protein